MHIAYSDYRRWLWNQANARRLFLYSTTALSGHLGSVFGRIALFALGMWFLAGFIFHRDKKRGKVTRSFTRKKHSELVMLFIHACLSLIRPSSEKHLFC